MTPEENVFQVTFFADAVVTPATTEEDE